MSDIGITGMRFTHEEMMRVVETGLKERHFVYSGNTPTPTDVTRNNKGEYIIRFEEEER